MVRVPLLGGKPAAIMQDALVASRSSGLISRMIGTAGGSSMWFRQATSSTQASRSLLGDTVGEEFEWVADDAPTCMPPELQPTTLTHKEIATTHRALFPIFCRFLNERPSRLVIPLISGELDRLHRSMKGR